MICSASILTTSNQNVGAVVLEIIGYGFLGTLKDMS